MASLNYYHNSNGHSYKPNDFDFKKFGATKTLKMHVNNKDYDYGLTTNTNAKAYAPLGFNVDGKRYYLGSTSITTYDRLTNPNPNRNGWKTYSVTGQDVTTGTGSSVSRQETKYKNVTDYGTKTTATIYNDVITATYTKQSITGYGTMNSATGWETATATTNTIYETKNTYSTVTTNTIYSTATTSEYTRDYATSFAATFTASYSYYNRTLATTTTYNQSSTHRQERVFVDNKTQYVSSGLYNSAHTTTYGSQVAISDATRGDVNYTKGFQNNIDEKTANAVNSILGVNNGANLVAGITNTTGYLATNRTYSRTSTRKTETTIEYNEQQGAVATGIGLSSYIRNYGTTTNHTYYDTKSKAKYNTTLTTSIVHKTIYSHHGYKIYFNFKTTAFSKNFTTSLGTERRVSKYETVNSLVSTSLAVSKYETASSITKTKYTTVRTATYTKSVVDHYGYSKSFDHYETEQTSTTRDVATTTISYWSTWPLIAGRVTESLHNF